MNLSSLCLAIFAFGLFPRLVRAYDLMGLSLFDPPRDLFEFDPSETFSAMLRRHQDAFQHAFFRGASSPSYPLCDMINDEHRFEVSVEFPDMDPNNVEVQYDEARRLLTISGHRESNNDETGYHFDSQFSRSFTLDPFVEVDQMTATFKNGKLTISAPKDTDRMRHTVRSIPVIQMNQLEGTNTEELDSKPFMANPPKEESKTADDWKRDSDPFHIKERIQKAHQQHTQHVNANDDPSVQDNNSIENPIEKLLEQDREQAYKTSDLRRR